ncbi:MAG TPA: DUF4838 domain-containing protein [Chthoniobacteraceae bacterium]|nr:DUF4838 domain-containing protein [Chthoniobacteraceae bacterium]
MTHSLPAILALALALLSFGGLAAARSAPEEAAEFVFVHEGTPAAVIVEDIPEGANAAIAEGIRRACGLMQFAVERATGVKPEIISAADAAAADLKPVLIGGGERTRATGLAMPPLPVEGYRIVVTPERCMLYGDFSGFEEKSTYVRTHSWTAPTPYYAVAEVIQSRWGGRWLWPGPNGFDLPARKRLALAAGDETFQPRAQIRWFSGPRLIGEGAVSRNRKGYGVAPDQEKGWHRYVQELADWYYFHRFGTRLQRSTMHSFGDWWEKYHADHPDFFAQPPPGFRQPWPGPTKVKLRLGNPAVVQTILAEWRAAGRPGQWGIGPNDGAGFCAAPETMAMDEPPNQDPAAVWNGEADLSARYSRFWEKLLHAFRKENREVQLTTLIYSRYRNAPAKGVDLTGLLGAFTHAWTPQARESWKAWSDAGARLFLRPNWFHLGAGAPYLQTHAVADFIRWSTENGSLGFYFDSSPGHWANQGYLYYVVARLGENPALSDAEIMDEYTSAFGSAKPLIAQYLGYWEAHSIRLAYPVSAGGPVSISDDSPYEALVKTKGIPKNPLLGSHHVLPDFYRPEVIEPASQLLERAAEAVKDEGREIRDRVRFLQLGLEHLVLNRDAVALGFRYQEAASAKNRAAYQEKVRELRAFRARVSPLNVVSETLSNRTDTSRNSPAAGKGIALEKPEEEGI